MFFWIKILTHTLNQKSLSESKTSDTTWAEGAAVYAVNYDTYRHLRQNMPSTLNDIAAKISSDLENCNGYKDTFSTSSL